METKRCSSCSESVAAANYSTGVKMENLYVFARIYFPLRGGSWLEDNNSMTTTTVYHKPLRYCVLVPWRSECRLTLSTWKVSGSLPLGSGSSQVSTT